MLDSGQADAPGPPVAEPPHRPGPQDSSGAAAAAAAAAASLSAATVPPPDAFIRFRLSAIDFVLAHEHSRYDVSRSPFAKDELRQVPTIRIFGATDRGQRVTAHVHGVYPYVYVEYKGKLDPDAVNDYIRRFGAALNHAMALSLPDKRGGNKKQGPPQFIAFVVLCKGINFYGYHIGYQPFLKVYMVNPRHKNRVAELLRSGAVLGTQFDVFEAHVPYLLQFMLDANLYGCGWVEVGECLIREEVPEHEPTPSDEYNPPSCNGPYAFRLYTTRTVPDDRMHPSVDAGGPAKISYEPIELDLPFTAILNRRRLTPRNLHHDFVEMLDPDSIERGKLVRSVKELWDDERQRRSARGESGPYDIVDDAPREWDQRPKDKPNWRREPEFRAKVDAKIRDDLKRWQARVGPRGKAEPALESYVDDKERLIERTRTGWLDRVRTTFEQVDAVSHERFELDERDKYPFGVWAVRGLGLSISARDEAAWLRAGTAEVDMSRLKASQAAGMAARAAQRRRPRDPAAGEDDEDDEMDGDLSDEGSDEDVNGRGRMPPPATQAEALRRSRVAMDRAMQRGREQSVEEGEWEKEPDDREDDEEDDDFWGMQGGTDRFPSRAPSEASYLGADDGDDDEDQPASRRSSVQPASVSPAKRPFVSPGRSKLPSSASDGDETVGLSPAKRARVEENKVAQALSAQGGAFGRQAASFIASPSPQRPQKATPPRRTSTSPTALRNRPLVGSPAVTPTKRLKANPFASPLKTSTFRIASTSSRPTTPIPIAAVGDAHALFTFKEPLDVDVKTEEPSVKPVVSRSFVSNRSIAPPLEHYLKSSAESSPSPSPQRIRSTVTPSQALAELADLPAGALDEDYHPTPTVKEEVPSQLEPQFIVSASSVDLVDVDDSVSPTRASSPPFAPPDSDLESEIVEDVKPLVPTIAPPAKKHVAFQLASSDSSAPASGAATPTPNESSGRTATPIQTSQNTSDTDSITAPAARLESRSDLPLSRRSFVFAERPPSAKQLVETIESYRQPRVVYKDAFYSKPTDVPKRAREYAGRVQRLKGSTIRFLPAFLHYDAVGERTPESEHSAKRRSREVKTWEFALPPPTKADMLSWLSENGLADGNKPRFDPVKSQIEGPTQKSDSDKFTAIKGASQREKQHMAVLAMELHVNTRGKLLPNPTHDAIEALFYCLQSDNDDLEVNGRSDNTHVGVIVVGDEDMYRRLGITDYRFEVVESERELIEALLDKLRFEWDPECLAGFEVHHASWGFLLERAESEYSWDIVSELGRVKRFDTGRFGNKQNDRWGMQQSSVLNFTGRHVLPIWRILKADNKFQQNSFEHIAWHVLHIRTPHLSHKTLTEWYTSGDPSKMARVLGYWRNRVEMDIEMIDAAEVVDQCCESARVFGVDFNSVRTRGSQFKVESVMFKLSKPESFLLLSPNRVQVGRQNAAECMPLIMEPQSAFYKGPLLVMDFQSLYPSVMIAYNYCYSTFLGRVSDFKGSNKFGTSEVNLPDGLLYLLKDHITISPNGMMFAKKNVRRGLLDKMLSELLDTRVMVKGSMKAVASDRALTKLLNARQLALKFLANVTYGYTSATFSGRMPAVEIADAIVQTGRETLERAMETVRSRKDWGAEVVYGDTDSLFIYLPGKSKEDAFRIGNEMAEVVTSQNPRPIKLKFEKVYLPSVLIAKKRYVGFKYEYLKQKEPDFDAKGIETIRRDGIAGTQKMQETCLKILFRTSDLSLVKDYCLRQWKKLQAGDVSPQDFTIAKKVKLGSYAEGRLPPPGAAVAARAMQHDPRAEPEYGERVPYIMFQAEPGQKQVHRAIAPGEFLADSRLRLDATHYIERMMIPPLERIFNLIGADVKSWYREMGKAKRVHRVAEGKGKAVMLEQHFISDRCLACDGPDGFGGLCPDCRAHPAEVAYSLASRKQVLLQRQRALHEICVSCSANPRLEPIACDSIDCPNLYARVRNSNELDKVTELSSLPF